MRDFCMIPMTKSQVGLTGEYCDTYSSVLPASVAEQLDFTDKEFDHEAVMAPSTPQCSWLISFTRTLRPARVLELGTFTGVSALAFYEATRDTQAEIVSIDVSEKFLKIANDAFTRHRATDRIHTIQGECLKMLETLEGEFDLIYIDAANDEYEAYTRFILDQKLLSRRGVILVDDTLHEGSVIDESFLEQMKKEKHPVYVAWTEPVHKFNLYAASEERVFTTLLPIFNGVTQIMWK